MELDFGPRHGPRGLGGLFVLDDIHGKVFFVLEPLCTPFETTFTLTHTSGGGWKVVHTWSRDAFPPGHELRD